MKATLFSKIYKPKICLKQTKKLSFLTVAKPDEARIILHDAMKLYLERSEGKEVIQLRANIRKFVPKALVTPSLYLALIHFLLNFVFLKIVTKNRLASYRYGSVEIGRYAAATALRNPKACIDEKKYLGRYLASAFKGIFVYTYANWISSRVECAYMHDTSYLNGIIIDVLLKKRVRVFLKGYPYNLVLCCGDHLNQTNILVRRDNRSDFSKAAAEEYMENRLGRPSEAISYYKPAEAPRDTPDFSFQKECAVVYAHSFTDAQLNLGYDGFNSVYEWLIYTVDTLSKLDIDVFIKGHPNFWAPEHETDVVQWDKLIWGRVVERYKDKNNVKVIDWPLDNYSLLAKLDKDKSILVSHHGNAIIEGAFLGYRTISSACSLWGENYCVGKVWKNPREYKKMLSINSWDFPEDRTEVLRFVHDKYLNPNGFHAENLWLALIAKSMKIDIKELMKRPSLIDRSRINNYDSLLNEIADSIVELNEC